MNTERFTAACHAMQGYLASFAVDGTRMPSTESAAQESVRYADALLAELAKTEPKEEGIWTDRERKAIANLSKERGLSESGILRQAIRLYEAVHAGDITVISSSQPLGCPDLEPKEEAKPEADAEGWIPHKPGDPMPDCEVEAVQFKNGETAAAGSGGSGFKAQIWKKDWEHTSRYECNHIIAYKPA